ncbi:MAG TPA: hypothetical protein VMH61_06935, partial [Candidatus Acidoferrales bacterium]|nr:hypothetical protein [Candidatus Acidoferrales bacterium]
MLSADFARLGAELAIVDPGRDWLHCDVMDQHFVPNLTFGPMIIEAANRLTEAPLDVHLMIERPWETLAAFRAAGGEPPEVVHLVGKGNLEAFAAELGSELQMRIEGLTLPGPEES